MVCHLFNRRFLRASFYQIQNFHIKYGFVLSPKWYEWNILCWRAFEEQNCRRTFHRNRWFSIFSRHWNALYRFRFSFHKDVSDSRYAQNRSTITFMKLSIHIPHPYLTHKPTLEIPNLAWICISSSSSSSAGIILYKSNKFILHSSRKTSRPLMPFMWTAA